MTDFPNTPDGPDEDAPESPGGIAAAVASGSSRLLTGLLDSLALHGCCHANLPSLIADPTSSAAAEPQPGDDLTDGQCGGKEYE